MSDTAEFLPEEDIIWLLAAKGSSRVWVPLPWSEMDFDSVYQGSEDDGDTLLLLPNNGKSIVKFGAKELLRLVKSKIDDESFTIYSDIALQKAFSTETSKPTY